MDFRFGTLRSALALTRWLGPWTSEDRMPSSIRRSSMHVPVHREGERPFEAWVYRPKRRPRGALLLIQGLHYAGPADPRFDRFCRVLASAGIVVLAPFLPDFAAMRVEPELATDAERAFEALLALPDLPRHTRPGVFSISFGSLAAVELAARRSEVGGLMLFGGYADFLETIRFCLTGAEGRPYDPLNQCVVFMNLLELLEVEDPASVNDAWLEFVKRTWGRPHLKVVSEHHAVARTIAQERNLKGGDEQLFLVGTGVLPGAHELMETTLPQKEIGFLDPLPWARKITCPTLVSHGREDDVIPFEHAAKLAEAIPNSRCLLTGLYSHTGQSGLAMIPDEMASAVGILVGMVKTSRGR